MSTVTALVLLFGYHTSTEGASASATVAAAPVVAGSGATTAGAADGSGTTSSGATSSSSSTNTSTSTSTTTTLTGTAASTRYGPVQVEITVASDKVTAVDVVQYPTSNGQDQQINSRALPTLVQETLTAQSADIDMVSGATYTSEGYVQSLQSALDQAGL